ncbi:MAG: ABC transporter ATP-binding protein [Actinomycetes bacterium]
MTSQRAAISVKGLRKSYAGKDAVAGIDLEVAQGEIFAILGPNGAGKTTTVEILEGYRTRDAGEVLVLGEDPSKPASGDRTWRNRIGIVLQSAADAPDLTVAETVHHFANYYTKAKDPDHVIDLVGLSEKAKAKVATLSGGQRRRLDVALGIIGSPEILFLDEPTTGFDPEARRAFWELIRALRDEGTTILLTTHYLDEAEALADRVAVINKGLVLEIATPELLGGRATAPARVTWSESGQPRSEQTQSPTDFVKTLASRLDGEIPDLAITRPSLEDIYLGMIGEL